MGCFVKKFYNFLIYIFLIFSFDKNIIINANQKKINKLEINNLFNYNSKMSTQNKYNKMNKKIDKSELIDNKILEVGKPLFVDHLIYPILGILESIIVSRISGLDQLAVQTLGDQVFGIFLNLFSFIPPILLPMISKLDDRNKESKLIDISFISVLISIMIGSIVSILVITFSKNILFSGLLISKNKISDSMINNLEYYFKVKFLSFPICLCCGVLFSILKGNMNFDLLIKSNFICNLTYIILNPFFVNFYGLDGINFLCISIEFIKCVIFTYNLIRIIGPIKFYMYIRKIKQNPKLFFMRLWEKLYFFVNNGIFIQFKNIIRKTTYMKINTKILSMDNTGKLLGIHVILCKFYDLFYILFKSINSVASILIPKIISNINQFDSKETINRFIFWANRIGLFQLLICVLNIFVLHILNDQKFLLSKNLVWITNYLFESKNIDEIKYFLKIIGETLLFTNLTCYLNGITGFYEILLQSNNKYKFHSIVSIILSVLTFSTIPFYKDLRYVWITSLSFSALKYYIVKKYYEKNLV